MTILGKGIKEGCKNVECIVANLYYRNFKFLNKKDIMLLILEQQICYNKEKGWKGDRSSVSTFIALDTLCDAFIGKADSIMTYLNLNRITMNSAEKTVEMFDEKVDRLEHDPKKFLDSIEYEMAACASDLVRYIENRFEIYDLLEKDLIKGRGYANLVSITADYYAHGKSVKHKIELNTIQQKANAQRIASSKVTGLGFGIISNSLAAQIVYGAQNEAAIKKQAAEAEEYLATRNAEISIHADGQWYLSQQQYFQSTLAPRMREAIPYVYTEMLARCVTLLGKRNCINVELIESFDFERSQAILDKAYSISISAHRIIEDALRWCPYNINIYVKAKQCGLFNEKMQALTKALHLNIAPSAGKLNVSIDRLAAIRKRILPAQNRLVAELGYVAGVNVDGTIEVFGRSDNRCEISTWKDIKAISSGRHHTIGLKRDNTVISTKFCKAYANDKSAHLGQCEVSGWRDIIAVSTFWDHTVGLKSDGSVVAVGDNEDGQCEVSDWKDIIAIDAGASHTVGLKADGTVVAVGSNVDGECDVSEWADIVAIGASCRRTVGLKADGTVVAAGYDIAGECDVSEWTDIVAVSAGFEHTVGLKADGTVVAVGDNAAGECEVTEWIDIVAVYAGNQHTMGLKSDGTVIDVGVEDLSPIISKWRLFHSVDTIEEEEAAALKWQEEERIAEARRKEAERIAVLKKQEEEKAAALKRQEEQRERQRRRDAGLCQYCGSAFKGLFSKKCSSCGLRKDY